MPDLLSLPAREALSKSLSRSIGVLGPLVLRAPAMNSPDGSGSGARNTRRTSFFRSSAKRSGPPSGRWRRMDSAMTPVPNSTDSSLNPFGRKTVSMTPSTNSSISDRDIRQRSIVPPERLAACHALVIGVGAIGRQVALQLAALGVPRMTFFDDDDVGVENLAPQGYWPEDLGTSKVLSTLALCRRINPENEITAHAERFKRSTASQLPSGEGLIVFACVDSITTRNLLWECLRNRAALSVY